MTAGRPAGRAHPIKEVIRTMADISNAALAEAWRQLWNGDLEQLDVIVASDSKWPLRGMGFVLA